MHEFNEEQERPLSINLPTEQFVATLEAMSEQASDELAYAHFAECLDEAPAPEAEETEIFYKQGRLLEHIGHIDRRRGDYEEALGRYRAARAVMERVSEAEALAPTNYEASILIHEMNNPIAAIEPYETAKDLYEKSFASSVQPPSNHAFSTFVDTMSHLAGAYQAAGETQKLRELNQAIMAFGAITPAVFGFDPCHEDPGQSGPQFLFGVQMKPLFIEIKEKLLDPPPADATPEVQLAGLQSLERLIDRDDFLPDMPEQRDYLLMLIHSKYSELTKDNWEDERHIKKALAIAKEHRLIVPTVSIYLGLGNNQAKRKLPLAELIKTTRKAFAAAEVCLDKHVSVEASRITVAADLMFMYLETRGDEEGISKIEQRLANRGLRAVADAPSAATPWLN